MPADPRTAPRPRSRRGSWTTGGAFALAAALALTGCGAPRLVVERHLLGDDAPDLAARAHDDAARTAALEVAIQPAACEVPIEGIMVELARPDGELVARFFTEEAPRRLDEVPPGEYVLRVHADAIGGGLLEAGVELRPGELIAIGYDDGSETRQAWRRFGHAAGEAAVVAAQVLIVVALVTARVAIEVAAACGS